MDEKTEQPSRNDFDDLGLSAPARRALAAAGYTRLEQLTETTENALLQLHGLGPKTIRTLRPVMESQGLAFAAESE